MSATFIFFRDGRDHVCVICVLEYRKRGTHVDLYMLSGCKCQGGKKHAAEHNIHNVAFDSNAARAIGT
jgi:hypothetical protein